MPFANSGQVEAWLQCHTKQAVDLLESLLDSTTLGAIEAATITDQQKHSDLLTARELLLRAGVDSNITDAIDVAAAVVADRLKPAEDEKPIDGGKDVAEL